MNSTLMYVITMIIYFCAFSFGLEYALDLLAKPDSITNTHVIAFVAIAILSNRLVNRK